MKCVVYLPAECKRLESAAQLNKSYFFLNFICIICRTRLKCNRLTYQRYVGTRSSTTASSTTVSTWFQVYTPRLFEQKWAWCLMCIMRCLNLLSIYSPGWAWSSQLNVVVFFFLHVCFICFSSCRLPGYAVVRRVILSSKPVTTIKYLCMLHLVLGLRTLKTMLIVLCCMRLQKHATCP
jgi:hypothetical protein